MTYPLEYDARTGSGFFVNGLAGENLGDRKLVYIVNNAWKHADAAIAISMPVIGLTMGAIQAGKWGKILIQGFIGDENWTWTVGNPLYASESVTGNLTQTSPPNPLYFTQEIGFPIRSTQIFFSPHQVLGNMDATYTRTESLSGDEFGRGAANNPTVRDQDNVTLYEFTPDTDFMTYKFPVPSDYAGGGLKFKVVWTNDDGVDDNGTNVRARFDYQVSAEGDVISGSHANSPKNVNDAYTSASGSIECHSDYVTIADADFSTGDCIYIKLSFVTAPATILTCEPRLIGTCIQYTAYTFS